ncbi:MAG: N-acetylneuraminate synthase family protein [Longimicrobiales bacterium]
MAHLDVGGRRVGPGEPPFIIAEAGVHHRNDLALALRYIDEASRAGADAIKFQTYSADRLVTRWAPAYWDSHGRTQYEVFAERSLLSRRDYERMVAHAAQRGIAFLSTPFDADAATLLAELGMPAFKIASADITHLPLLEEIGGYGLPVLLSTGASTMAEVKTAVDTLDRAGAPVALLHCSLAYPTPVDEANLLRIRMLAEHFPDRVLGYSDHVRPSESTLSGPIAVALGAAIVEKHFTLEPGAVGDDHYHSVDPPGLDKLVRDCAAAAAMTPPADEIREGEEPARENARRSIVAVRRIDAGQVVSSEDVAFKRPGTGLSPADVERVVGRRVKRALDADDLIQLADLE